MKQNIIFQQDWADHILTWDKDTAYDFMIALLEYGFYKNDGVAFTNRAVQRIFEEAKNQLDANRAKYEAKAESAKSARGYRGQKTVQKSELKSTLKSELKSEQKTELNSTSIDKDIDIDITSNEVIKDNVVKPDTFDRDIKEIVDYLNQKTQSNFKAKTEETRKSIRARLKEGYTVEDFKRVIDSKSSDWSDSERMREYLRPSTLFRPANFEAYLNEANRPKVKKKTEFPQREYDFDELEKMLVSN